jgi:cyclopropane fatty-acyl-phospholipid synthase-like methyltransferase
MISGVLNKDDSILTPIKSRYGRSIYYLKKNGSKTVLDIGCSVGLGSNLLASSGFKVWGIDYNKKSIEMAKRMFKGIEFEAADGGSFRKGRYDAIVALEVLEHLKDYRKAISNWFSMLENKGILIISTPNARFRKERGTFHEKEFTIDEIRSLLPGSKIEGFDWHYVTTKPVTLLFGKNIALKFRMSLNALARRFPGCSNNFFIVARK